MNLINTLLQNICAGKVNKVSQMVWPLFPDINCIVFALFAGAGKSKIRERIKTNKKAPHRF